MLSRVVSAVPPLTPFIGPETLERQMGRKFDVRLGANESLFGPSPKAIAAMAEAAARGHFYCDPEGYELRTALAKASNVPYENVTFASGIDEILSLLARAFIDPGSKVVTTLGSYPTFEYVVIGVGGDLVKVPYRNDRVDLEGLIAASQDARIVYLANPDNPSGSWYTPAQILNFLDALPSTALLILDEAYFDFAPETTDVVISIDDPRLVRVRTFSKSHGMAGIRVGYMLGHEDHVSAINRIRLHFGVSIVGQAAAIASLGDMEFVSGVIRDTIVEREKLAVVAQELGLRPIPSHTNFLTIDIGSVERAMALVPALREKGIFIRKPMQPPLDTCIRVSIGRAKDMARFVEVFRSVLDLQPALRPSS